LLVFDVLGRTVRMLRARADDKAQRSSSGTATMLLARRWRLTYSSGGMMVRNKRVGRSCSSGDIPKPTNALRTDRHAAALGDAGGPCASQSGPELISPGASGQLGPRRHFAGIERSLAFQSQMDFLRLLSPNTQVHAPKAENQRDCPPILESLSETPNFHSERRL